MDREVVEQNAAALERMRRLVGKLTDDQLGQDLGDGWTPAALLAHVAFWDRRVAVLLDRWSHADVAPSPVDLDAVNDAMLPQWRLIPPRAAVEDALAAGEAANQAIAGVSPARLSQIRAATDLRFNRSGHRNAHVDQIEQGLGG